MIQDPKKLTIFSYGAKLFNARSADDPELQKLEMLFKSLQFHDTRGGWLWIPLITSGRSTTIPVMLRPIKKIKC